MVEEKSKAIRRRKKCREKLIENSKQNKIHQAVKGDARAKQGLVDPKSNA